MEVNSTDSFCEYCGIVFEEYAKMRFIKEQKQTTQPIAPTEDEVKKLQHQKELASKFLCNTNSSVTVTTQTNAKGDLVSSSIKISRELINNSPQSNANQSIGDNKDEKEPPDFLVKALFLIAIIVAILFVYYFIII